MVRLALRNFRNKTGFHECPRCKSRSVWRADPHGALEETLHLLLRVSAYRCARCDKRFMDAKAYAGEVTPAKPGRLVTLLRRMLKSTERKSFEGLQLNTLFAANSEKREARLPDSVRHMTKVS